MNYIKQIKMKFLNNKFHPRCSSEKDIIDDTEKILQTLKIDYLDMLQSHLAKY